MADLEANALDVIAEVKKVKKKKEVEEAVVNMVLVATRKKLEKAMADYERAFREGIAIITD